jgi:hypothetical protein
MRWPAQMQSFFAEAVAISPAKARCLGEKTAELGRILEKFP